MTDSEFRARLRHPDPAVRAQWQGVLLREATYREVWRYVKLSDVLANWDNIRRHLGRRRAFWEWLFDGWRAAGILERSPSHTAAANKVCALISRSEVRDLVDLRALLDAGEPLERALDDAGRKEAGADAATLAWVLSQLSVGPEARLPAGVDPVALEAFRAELVRRLQSIARREAP